MLEKKSLGTPDLDNFGNHKKYYAVKYIYFK